MFELRAALLAIATLVPRQLSELVTHVNQFTSVKLVSRSHVNWFIGAKLVSTHTEATEAVLAILDHDV